jgi:hypothetical protein
MFRGELGLAVKSADDFPIPKSLDRMYRIRKLVPQAVVFFHTNFTVLTNQEALLFA